MILNIRRRTNLIFYSTQGPFVPQQTFDIPVKIVGIAKDIRELSAQDQDVFFAFSKSYFHKNLIKMSRVNDKWSNKPQILEMPDEIISVVVLKDKRLLVTGWKRFTLLSSEL